ncbi:hypothetical protein [Actinocrispum sp. NPDC049592]|uniref:hypothetical protein n=1 Tax=Actinocrispum sp. NPDC049592 TaxID=3154835 RepID=UPI0034191E1F
MIHPVDAAPKTLLLNGLMPTLRRSADPLVLVVSDVIHQSVIRHGYQGINDLDYAATVTIRLAGRQHLGWVHFAGEPSELALMGG